MSDTDPEFAKDDASIKPPAPVNRRRRASAVTIIGRVLLVLLALVFLAWAILFITKGRFLKSTFERYASQGAGRSVKVAGDFQLYFDPITIKFLADGLTVANPAWRGGNFYKSDHVEARISTAGLLWGERRVKLLDVAGAKLDLAWDKARARNTFTFGDGSKPKQKFELPDIVRAQVVRTTVDYVDPLLFLKTRIRVETVRAADTKFNSDIRFSGTGTLRDRPFTMTGSLLSPNEIVAGGKNRLRLSARSGPTVLDVSGTLPGATIIEGADLKLVARGDNIARLMEFLGATTPDTRTYRVTSNMTKQGGAWKLTQIAGRFGASDLAGALTVTMPGERLHFDADLRTRKLDIIDAGPFIGYDPVALARGQVATVAGGRTRLLPDAPLRIDAIKRFDADVRYRVATIRAPNLPISNVVLTLKLDRSLLLLTPLTFDVAGGKLWSDISIDARRQPVFTRYDVRLSPTPLGRLLAQFGTDQAGTTGTVKARIQMTGSGDSVRRSLASSNGRIAIILPRGTFWTRNVQLSELDIGTYVQKLIGKELKDPVQINCGLAGFTVRNGIAAADPIVVDTRKNVIVGRGGFSFRDESLDLAVRADAKTFSLFSAQSPIGVKGSFAKPGVQIISPELVGRAGIGLGLAVFATPLAGVLAFVDVGDAKSTQCGPVLSGARAVAQRDSKGRPRDDVGRGTTSKAEDGAKPQRKKFLGIF